MNLRTSDNYVQGVVESWGPTCGLELARRKLPSKYYYTLNNPLYAYKGQRRYTGFYWNGKNAGSEVCVLNIATHHDRCGNTHW